MDLDHLRNHAADMFCDNGESKLIFRIVNLSTYYLGQLLIAGSMYFLTR